MKIDIHSHVYPKKYLDMLDKLGKLGRDATGKMVILNNRSLRRTRVTAFFSSAVFDLEKRIESMDRFGIDKEVISLSNPWVDFLDPERSVDLARVVNRELSKMVQKHPDRFVGLAVLPLKNMNKALDELDIATEELELKGVIMGSNVMGKYPDAPEFQPLYERAAQLDVPIFLHPISSREIDALKDYDYLIPGVEFPFDTTRAVSRLIFSGVLEKNPNLKLIVAHLGGTLPYLSGRLDVVYDKFLDCKKYINKKPSEFLKKNYYDIICYSKAALTCAYELLGPEQLLFGTDYPFAIGDRRKIIESVQRLSIEETEKAEIFSENAIRLLNI